MSAGAETLIEGQHTPRLTSQCQQTPRRLLIYTHHGEHHLKHVMTLAPLTEAMTPSLGCRLKSARGGGTTASITPVILVRQLLIYARQLRITRDDDDCSFTRLQLHITRLQVLIHLVYECGCRAFAEIPSFVFLPRPAFLTAQRRPWSVICSHAATREAPGIRQHYRSVVN